ncbi:uncharacterized protein G2W53_027712 [Senna tora]|uniref:Uncharacterized protein n=1 Tax=Senna tora TaxID=362788 RepID=A0A834TJ66_9FABA|nr:uncharacterized protein G2W53_027712 [Senna tora]
MENGAEKTKLKGEVEKKMTEIGSMKERVDFEMLDKMKAEMEFKEQRKRGKEAKERHKKEEGLLRKSLEDTEKRYCKAVTMKKMERVNNNDFDQTRREEPTIVTTCFPMKGRVMKAMTFSEKMRRNV